MFRAKYLRCEPILKPLMRLSRFWYDRTYSTSSKLVQTCVFRNNQQGRGRQHKRETIVGTKEKTPSESEDPSTVCPTVREFLRNWDNEIYQSRKRWLHRKVEPILTPKKRWGVIKIIKKQTPLRAYQAALLPTVNDPITIRRSGEVVDIKTAVRNYWAFPLVGFNSILEVPVYPFEVLSYQSQRELRTIILPNGIFGLPLRPDILHMAYRYYVRAYTGWTERMQLYKWEWPGTRKKHRRMNSGQARMDWKRAPSFWPGSYAKPIRPRDHRCQMNGKVLYFAFKNALSAKFAQDQIRVVEHFNLNSHKTKHCVGHFRRLVGLRARRLLVVHTETGSDVNDNFRWATANICGIERQVPRSLTVYNLMRSDKVIFTRDALLQTIQNIRLHPGKQGWKLQYATPDRKRAPKPKPVSGWDLRWKEQKQREGLMDYKVLLDKMSKHWKWSDDWKGPVKIWREDPLKHFQLKEWSVEEKRPPWEVWETFHRDSDPLNEQDGRGTLRSASVEYVPLFEQKPHFKRSTSNEDDEIKELLTKEDVIKLCAINYSS